MVYSIFGIVAIIINLIVNRDIFKAARENMETGAQRAYRLFNYGILAYHITDVLWGFCDASGSQWLLYGDTLIYYIAMYVAVMLWAIYAVKYLDERSAVGKILCNIVNVLFVMEIFALLINHFVHFFFWVDEQGDYHAYTFRYVALAIQISLFLLTSGYAFLKGKEIKSGAVRNRYRTIGAFGITMSVAIAVQILYPLLPIYSIGYMIGICLIHSYIIEDENAELRKNADEANQAKTNFLFSMSHDIRTPMNAILGYTDIGLFHEEDTEEMKGCFEKIKTAGGHLLSLINDILEMSRIEAGKVEITEDPMDIRESIIDIEPMCQTLAQNKKIDYKTEIGQIDNYYVYADKLHLNEVLINLISNAIKYTPEGGCVRYTVNQIGGVTDGKVRYRFEIIDNGIGMGEEFQKHLFETFSREENTSVSKIEGTGLGLSIVKNIVDLCGGDIRVKSKQKEGSTFTVEISFRIMEEAAIEAYKQETTQSNRIPEELSLEGLRVLLVEDNEMNREIATELLSVSGVLVETAENGKLAVQAVTEKGMQYYDTILMDIQMPVMNGYEATKEIRAMPGGDSIPIIALSANAFEEDVKKSIENGMNAHVAKPINAKLLLEALKTMHCIRK